MLIEFTVGNYLSIKDKQTLRMDASSITEYQDRLIDAGRYKLLRSAVIYGANASGKSNVLKAMAAMREIVTKSAQRSSTDEIDVEPFLLSTETEHAPTFFEIIFLIDGVRYRYGFEADQKLIHAEWLFETKKQQEKPLFVREDKHIQVSKSFVEGKSLKDRTRTNALFLAVCDQFNGIISESVVKWLSSFNVESGIVHDNLKFRSLFLFENPKLKRAVFNFIENLNLGFDDIIVPKINEMNYSDYKEYNGFEKFQNFYIKQSKSTHKKYDKKNAEIGLINFDIIENESSGTNKIIDLSGPIITAIIYGSVLLIDELDAKLHPLLTKEIIKFFNNPDTNPLGAQLIFATHDTNLLTYGQFRRDQIYFTEKDQYGATSLYSLVEYKEEDGGTVRKDRSFEKDYIQGRYGAIPFIGDFSKLTSSWQEK